jgi:hypothetical protein
VAVLMFTGVEPFCALPEAVSVRAG